MHKLVSKSLVLLPKVQIQSLTKTEVAALTVGLDINILYLTS